MCRTGYLIIFGFTASQGDISLLWVIFATSIGAIIGDFISYACGRYGSGFVKEHRGFLRLSHVEVGRAFFKTWWEECVPWKICGTAKTDYSFHCWSSAHGALEICIFECCRSFLWAITYIVLGYYFGANWMLIDTIISRIGIIFSSVIVLGFLYAFQVRRKKRLDALNTQLNPDSGKIDNLL